MAAQAAGPTTTAAEARAADAWTVDARELDAEAEMRRTFGAKAVRAAQRELGGGGGGGARGGRGAAAPRALRRVLLVQPRAEWARPSDVAKQRLVDSDDAAVGGRRESRFAFEYTGRYASRLREFEALVQITPDPNMIMELLRDEPGHVAALLQLHEVATQTHQPDLAAEFLERALWAHELAYHPAFVAAWLRGDARLRGALPANAPFFRALHHHALALSARGCHASSLATARLALSLDRDDPTRLALRIDLLALRAHQPAALLALHDAHGATAEWHKYPGYAWSLALASARPTAAASRDGTAPARSYDDVRVGDIPRELKARVASALLDFPMMVPAALHACAASNAAATALSARWQQAFGRSNLEPPSTALRHLVALYWERAAELWSARPLIAWLIDEATHVLDHLDDAALGRGPAACARWWRPGVANPFQGDAYAALRSEQVVIPEEEEGGGPPPGPPVPEVEVVEAADGADGGGGGGFAELAPLEEETEALAARVGELESMLGGGGVAAALRGVIGQRLSVLNERLTQHMIAIDSVELPAATAEAARPVRKALLVRADELCARVDRLSLMQQGEG